MYRHAYHLTPPSGWMNDPNGFCFFGGRYHLFYQHYPEAPRWGRMRWGHAVSCDLVRWEHLPIALRPDRFWDCALGCFSGSAVVRAGELRLFYTGVSPLGQYQMAARSTDGLRFEKDRGPVIGPGKLPPGGSARAFRDPKVFERDGAYYCLLGGSLRDPELGGSAAQVAIYRSPDLRRWTCAGTLLRDALPSGGIFECPDYASVDGKDILFASPMYLPENEAGEFENLHSAVYLPGALDPARASFIPDDGPRRYRELDGGTDFYASQTMTAPDGRVVMVAWMQMWKRTMPTAAEGWAGAMTVPRELSYEGGSLVQRPVRELESYRTNTVAVADRVMEGNVSFPGIEGTACDLELVADMGGASALEIRLFASHGAGDAPPSYAAVRYDRRDGTLTLDRSRSPVLISSSDSREARCDVRTTRMTLDEGPLGDGLLRLRLLLDRSSLEVFAGGGIKTMSALYYAPAGHDGIEFFSDGPVRVLELRKHDIEVGRQ